MKLTVIGAGAIGAAIARTLQQRPDVEVVQVCDARAKQLQALQDDLGSTKIRSFQVDARDVFVLRSIVQGSQCVIASVPPEHYPGLATLCLSLGVHYLDLGGSDAVVDRLLALDEEARAQGVLVVPNNGIAPGLVNVLCLEAVAQFDEVDAAQLRVGDVPVDPAPPFNFTVAWSPEKLIEDYTNPVQLIEDGQVVQQPPLTHVEHLFFAEPYGRLEAFCTQGGLSTLARELAGRVRSLDHKTIRWPGHAAQMQFLLALGFGDRRSLDVKTHLTYRDVLVRRMRERLSTPQRDVLLLRVLVRGLRDGRRETLVYELVSSADDSREATAVQHVLSVCAATTACMIASGTVSGGGAMPPERAIPRAAYLRELAEHGLTIETRRYDGFLDVTDPLVAE